MGSGGKVMIALTKTGGAAAWNANARMKHKNEAKKMMQV